VKFSDLNNPSAAREAIKDFQRRFSARVCLSPTGGCSGDIIAAHTLSAASMLRPISRDGHVYALRSNLYAPSADGPATIGLLGIKNTSVFNGFCATHDKALFSPIEDEQFNCKPQQLFMHAYRAIAKESYLKRKQAEFPFLPVETIKNIHGLPKELDLQFSEDALLSQAASLRGAEEIERTKAEMDKHLVASDYPRTVRRVRSPFPSRHRECGPAAADRIAHVAGGHYIEPALAGVLPDRELCHLANVVRVANATAEAGNNGRVLE